MARTVMEVMEATAIKHPFFPALKSKISNQWNPITWQQYREQTRLVARALIQLGLQPKDSVCIVSENCPKSLISNLAVIYPVGITTGITTNHAAQHALSIVNNSDCSILIVQDLDQLKKFQQLENQFPKLKAIVLLKGTVSASNVYGWNALPKIAEQTSIKHLEETMDAQRPDDVCTLVYNSPSQSTSPPKGVMLTHANLTWTAKKLTDAFACSAADSFIS